MGGGGSSRIFSLSPNAYAIQWGGGGSTFFVNGALLHFLAFQKGGPLLHFWDFQKGGPSFTFLRFSKGGSPGPPGPPLNRPLSCCGASGSRCSRCRLRSLAGLLLLRRYHGCWFLLAPIAIAPLASCRLFLSASTERLLSVLQSPWHCFLPSCRTVCWWLLRTIADTLEMSTVASATVSQVVVVHVFLLGQRGVDSGFDVRIGDVIVLGV